MHEKLKKAAAQIMGGGVVTPPAPTFDVDPVNGETNTWIAHFVGSGRCLEEDGPLSTHSRVLPQCSSVVS